jgi:hypothetical protein
MAWEEQTAGGTPRGTRLKTVMNYAQTKPIGEHPARDPASPVTNRNRRSQRDSDFES